MGDLPGHPARLAAAVGVHMKRVEQRWIDWVEILAWEKGRHGQLLTAALKSVGTLRSARGLPVTLMTRIGIDVPDIVAEDLARVMGSCPWRTVKPITRVHPGWSADNPKWQELGELGEVDEVDESAEQEEPIPDFHTIMAAKAVLSGAAGADRPRRGGRPRRGEVDAGAQWDGPAPALRYLLAAKDVLAEAARPRRIGGAAVAEHAVPPLRGLPG